MLSLWGGKVRVLIFVIGGTDTDNWRLDGRLIIPVLVHMMSTTRAIWFFVM